MPRKDRSNRSTRAARIEAPGADDSRRPPATGGRLSSANCRSLYAIIPGLFALLTSINTLSNGYASDDAHQVIGNAFVKSVANLPYAFTTSVWSFATDDIVFAVDSYYRPLFNILFTINYALYGSTAWGWHLTSVLVHTLATSLVFLVIKELASDGRLALITACHFAVHPAHP
jgi:4-amino-4-deoxy-L-arabinose transferase-like glycosyltransferase